MHTSVRLPFVRFLREASPENFLQLREAVIASPNYAPYANSLRPAHELLAQGKLAEALRFLESIQPHWIANPDYYRLLAIVYEKLGQDEAAQREHRIALLLVEGILSTGDGSEQQPYLVLRNADEYAVLTYLGRRSLGQRLHEKGGRQFDVQKCDDGLQIWFDVSAQFANLRTRSGLSR